MDHIPLSSQPGFDPDKGSASDEPIIGFAVVYRWRVRAEMEGDFVEAWAAITACLKARGSLGARLHRGQDGTWYSYAQWPSVEARAAAFALGPVDEEAGAVMKAAIIEHLPEIPLFPVADLLQLP